MAKTESVISRPDKWARRHRAREDVRTRDLCTKALDVEQSSKVFADRLSFVVRRIDEP